MMTKPQVKRQLSKRQRVYHLNDWYDGTDPEDDVSDEDIKALEEDIQSMVRDIRVIEATKDGMNHTSGRSDGRPDNERTGQEMSTSIQAAQTKLMTTIKDEGTAAAWRVAAKRAMNHAVIPAVKMALGKIPGASDIFDGILFHQAGEGAIYLLAGTALSAIPSRTPASAKIGRLASEFRIMGWERIEDSLVGTLLDPLAAILRDLPED